MKKDTKDLLLGAGVVLAAIVGIGLATSPKAAAAPMPPAPPPPMPPGPSRSPGAAPVPPPPATVPPNGAMATIAPLPRGTGASHPAANQQISVFVERPGAHLASSAWADAPAVNQEIADRLLARGYRVLSQGYRPSTEPNRSFKDLLVVDVGQGAGIPRQLGPGLTVYGG